MKLLKYICILTCCAALMGCSGNTVSYVELGMEALEEYNYDQALSEFDAAIAQGKQLMLAYRGAGIAYLGKGEYDSAVSSFSRALLEKAARNDDARKDILYYKAAAEYNNEDYTSAIASYNKILDIELEKDAYYLRGNAYLAKDQLDDAIIDYEQAVSMDREDYDLYIQIYEILSEKGYTDQGIDYLQKALNAGAAEQDNSYNVGRIYYYLGDYENASTHLGIAFDQGDYEAGLVLGKVYLALNDSANAQSVFSRYLTEVGESSKAYNGLAMCKIEEGDYDNALAMINRGLATDDQEEIQNLLFNEIVVYERLYDFETAKQKAEEYVAVYPRDEAGNKEYNFLMSR